MKTPRLLFVLCILLCGIESKSSVSADSLRNVLSHSLSDTNRVNTLISLAKTLRNSETLASFSHAREAYELSIQKNYPKGVGYSSDILGVLYLNFGDYKKSLFHHFQSLKIFERLNETKGIAFTYNNLGAVHSHLKNYTKAKECYQKSLDIKLKNGMYKEASSSYINLGNIAMYQKQLNECIRYYLLGLNNARIHGDDQNITIGFMNLGEAYFDKSNVRLAENYYKKALHRVMKSRNKYFEGQIYFALGKIYDSQKKYPTSEIYFLKALHISQSESIKPLTLNIYKYASKMYQHRQEYEKALMMNQNYLALNDSIYTEEIAKSTNQLTALYELQKKEEEIKLLSQEKEIIQAKESKQAIIRNFFIVAFILISIIAFISLQSIARKQKSNRLLEIKNTKIEIQRSEIERKNIALLEFNKELLKENVVARYEILKAKVNPHFLFNNLSTLSSLIVEEPTLALAFVSKFAKLYRSIMEHGNSQLVSLSEELEVVNSYIYLCKMRHTNSLVIEKNIPQELKKLRIPPFSLQLAVENAIKHNTINKNYTLTIFISAENNMLQVKNNLIPKLHAEPSTGIGQQSIIERYKLITTQKPYFGHKENYYIAQLPLIV